MNELGGLHQGPGRKEMKPRHALCYFFLFLKPFNPTGPEDSTEELWRLY